MKNLFLILLTITTVISSCKKDLSEPQANHVRIFKMDSVYFIQKEVSPHGEYNSKPIDNITFFRDAVGILNSNATLFYPYLTPYYSDYVSKDSFHLIINRYATRDTILYDKEFIVSITDSNFILSTQDSGFKLYLYKR